jgi:two-component system, OmpR family, KDP operon response regulator KdpE
VCTRIREWSEVPIIILSASGTEDRKVAALNGGADDYVTKPFGMAELEARIRAVVRHRQADSSEPSPPLVVVGPLELDLLHYQARLDGRAVGLTRKEFSLLSFLARHEGKTCTHQMILTAVWGEGYDNEAQYVRVYVHRLRAKLHDESGTLIRTIPGIGYTLNPEPTTT